MKGGVNGTGFNHQMADSLIVRTGSTFDMSVPDMTTPLRIGGDLEIGGTLILSGAIGGDLELAGDWANNGAFTSNNRLITFNGDSNAVLKGSVATTFPFLTVEKGINKTMRALVPFTVGNAGGSTLRIKGGILDLNAQALTLGTAPNTLRIDSTFAKGQTLRTGGSSIAGFTFYRRGASAASLDSLGGKVDFSGGSAETLLPAVKGYNLLWLTGAATKSIGQNTAVADSLFIGTGTTLSLGATASIVRVRGNVVNNGTTNGTGTGRLLVAGNALQNMSGSGTYRNLDVFNAANVTSRGKPTIANELNILRGKVLQPVATDTITLAATATLTEAIATGNENFVRGNIKTTRVVGTTGSFFGGLGLSLSPGANVGTVFVNRQSGTPTNGQGPCCLGNQKQG